MRRAQAFVFLAVDEILDFPRHPAAVVDLQAFQQAFDQPKLVVGVDDLEVLRQARFAPVAPQQAVREAVKRADPQVADRHPEQPLYTPAHLRRRLVRERHGEECVRRDALDVDQPGRPVHENTRLAAAGAGDHQRRLGRRCDRLPLGVVQGLENRRYVHREITVIAGTGTLIRCAHNAMMAHQTN
jgi:hypothetical protein